QHPNIVQIYEVGEQAGQAYLALEYVDGGSLAQQLKGRPQSGKETAAMLETLARAVHAAHQAGVIHRDLTPGNILLTQDGQPKVTDFGLARQLDTAGQTTSDAILGTPAYMAPEQAAGKARSAGPPADIYALGVIGYEMLTGRLPFDGETMMDALLHV